MTENLINDVSALREGKHDISMEILHQAVQDFAQQAGIEFAQHAAVIAKCYAITIVSPTRINYRLIIAVSHYSNLANAKHL